MTNQEELKARLLGTRQYLIRLRLEKLKTLRHTQAIERDLRLLSRIAKIRDPDGHLYALRRHCVQERGAIDKILSEMAIISRYISDIKNELDQMGCVEY